jgi:hypothetical protein
MEAHEIQDFEDRMARIDVAMQELARQQPAGVSKIPSDLSPIRRPGGHDVTTEHVMAAVAEGSGTANRARTGTPPFAELDIGEPPADANTPEGPSPEDLQRESRRERNERIEEVATVAGLMVGAVTIQNPPLAVAVQAAVDVVKHGLLVLNGADCAEEAVALAGDLVGGMATGIRPVGRVVSSVARGAGRGAMRMRKSGTGGGDPSAPAAPKRRVVLTPDQMDFWNLVKKGPTKKIAANYYKLHTDGYLYWPCRKHKTHGQHLHKYKMRGGKKEPEFLGDVCPKTGLPIGPE